MLIDRLKLYKPCIDVLFNTTEEDLVEKLIPYGFELSKREDRSPILHGEAWINNEDKVIIHFYFSEDGKLESLMIHSTKKSNEDTIQDSYSRKQRWLESLFGQAHRAKQNYRYNIMNYSWKLELCTIEHFIKDRFGDEEGIYFNII